MRTEDTRQEDRKTGTDNISQPASQTDRPPADLLEKSRMVWSRSSTSSFLPGRGSWMKFRSQLSVKRFRFCHSGEGGNEGCSYV